MRYETTFFLSIRRLFMAYGMGLFLTASAPAHAAAVQEIKTPSGLTAWLIEEHSQPLIAVKVAFRGAGFAYDPEGKAGIANMTAGLLMEGAGELDAKAFNEALESKAIHINTGVDEDLLRVSMETLSEHKEAAFTHLGTMLAAPRFDGSAIDRIKSQTLSLLKEQETDPGYLLNRGWQEVAFGDHPYGKPILGTPHLVSGVYGSDFREFASHHLTRENIIIAVVGDITAEELNRLLDQHFAKLPEKYAPAVTVPEYTVPKEQKIKLVELDIPQTLISFGTAGVKRDDPDYFAAYVMNYLLGGSSALSTRLGNEIREKHGLAYTVFSRLDSYHHSSSWMGGFGTRGEEAGNALSILTATLKEFIDEGPSAKELADAKRYITGSFVMNIDSNADVANYLISMQLHKLGMDYLEKRNALIEAVKKEDVIAVTRKLLDADKLRVIMVGKPALKQPTAP